MKFKIILFIYCWIVSIASGIFIYYEKYDWAIYYICLAFLSTLWKGETWSKNTKENNSIVFKEDNCG